MAEYYFMSQLPSLDGVDENTAIPIAEERFADLCQRFLDAKTQQEIDRLTLVPPRESEGSSSNCWRHGIRLSVSYGSLWPRSVRIK